MGKNSKELFELIENNYYTCYNEGMVNEMILSGLCNRHIRYYYGRERKDNVFQLLGIECFLFKKTAYVLADNEEFQLREGDIILEADRLIKETKNFVGEMSFKICRTSGIVEERTCMVYGIRGEVKEGNEIKKEGQILKIKARHFSDKFNESLKEYVGHYSEVLIDLRGNMGGTVKWANGVLKILAGNRVDGYVVENQKQSKKIQFDDAPLISADHFLLIVDNTTMSSAELVVAVLKELGNVTTVGRRTYGKGVMCAFYHLANGYTLILPAYEFKTRECTQIEGQGILPDFTMEEYKNKIGEGYCV